MSDATTWRLTVTVRDQFFEFGHGCLVDAVANPWAIDFALHQAGFFQDLQVLGNGGLGQRHFLDDFAAHAGGTVEQQTDDPHPGWMGQCPAEFGQVFGPSYVWQRELLTGVAAFRPSSLGVELSCSGFSWGVCESATADGCDPRRPLYSFVKFRVNNARSISFSAPESQK
jgi:hypothetical protein